MTGLCREKGCTISLCWFSITAIKHYHKQSGLKQHKFILLQSWSQTEFYEAQSIGRAGSF